VVEGAEFESGDERVVDLGYVEAESGVEEGYLQGYR